MQFLRVSAEPKAGWTFQQGRNLSPNCPRLSMGLHGRREIWT